MIEYLNINKREGGLSVRAKLNKMFSALITGSEGMNQVWIQMQKILNDYDDLEELTEAQYQELKDQILKSFDYTDITASDLMNYINAINGGVAGFAESTEYNPNIPEDKAATIIAVGPGTYVNFKDVNGSSIVITGAQSFTVFYKAENSNYWKHKTINLEVTYPPITQELGNSETAVMSQDAVSKEFDSVRSDLTEITNSISSLKGKDYTSLMEVGYSLTPSSTVIGDIITLTRAANPTFNSIKIRVYSGDSYDITGAGGIGPRLYIVTDLDNKLVSIATAGLGASLTINIEKDGYLTVNARNDNITYITKVILKSVFVSKSGDENIEGVKTFAASPIIPTPTTDYQAATKEYVDVLDEVLRSDLQISKSNLESRTDALETGMSQLGEHYNLKLKSSAIGGDFPNVIGNVSQSSNTYQTPINSTLADLGIKRMGVNNKNSSSGNVELYISFNTALRQLYWDNNGKWCKIRWRLYSKNGTMCTLTGGRLSVLGTGQSVNYDNGKVTYKQINSQVFEVTALYQISVTGSLPSYIYLASVWESSIVPVDFVPGDFADGGVGIWFADTANKLDDNIIIEDWNLSIVDSEIFLTKGEGDARYAPISTSDIVNKIGNKIEEKFKIPSVIKGGGFNPVADVTGSSGMYKNDIVDSYLNEKQLSVINYTNKGGNNNVEVYSKLNEAFRQNYLDNNGRYIKIKFLVYSKQGVMCTATTPNRLGIIGIEQAISYNNGQVTYTQVSPQVFEVTMQWKIQQTALPSYIYITTVWESSIVPVDFVPGDLGVTGLGIWFADTLEEIPDTLLQYDWVYYENVALTLGEGDARYIKKTDITYDFDYNNIYYNQSCISKFLQKHRMEQVDSWNQLNVCLCGDSIFGRVDKREGWNPSSPQISYTPDMNNPSEVQAGYLTGHFPPNMWEQIVGFKILQMLQFKYADVKYFNHVAAEVTKSGTWTNIFPAGDDCLRLVTTNVINSYITLDFNSVTFVKFIYSCYSVSSATRKIKITFSDDNGFSWKTPAQLSLTESYASDVEGSGIYYLSALSYKWGNLIFGGLDKTKSYKIKVEKIDSAGTLNVWGFETWSNPRVNVIIAAEGGNVALSQASLPQRFYSDMYKQDLVIYELPYLNDLGVGKINNFKGSITPSSVSPTTPTVKDFYYCSQDGTYVNFNNLYAYARSYIEWDGTNWKIGSTQIKQTIDELYVPNNRLVFEKLLKQNINVLTLITHTSTAFSTRPYTQEYGLILLRMLVKQYGFASIDINKYQSKLNITNIYSDGTHLNDNGVELYRKLIYEVLDPKSECIAFSDCPIQNKKLTGSGASTDSISFGFEMKGIPTVRLFNNNSRTIVSVTNSGFTTTGTGNYDWEAFVE